MSSPSSRARGRRSRRAAVATSFAFAVAVGARCARAVVASSSTFERCRAMFGSGGWPSTASEASRAEYCVVGAGPGGLQMALYLSREVPNASMVVFDKSARAGSFFETFPIHRRLISINKVHFSSKQRDADFRMRHDWNSLIDPLDEGELDGKARRRLLMQNYSLEYYPRAEDLSRYLRDFAAQKLAGYVSYNTDVLSIDRQTPDSEFAVNTSKGLYTCKNVVMATGLHTPKRGPKQLWHPKVIGYHELPADPKMFTGKRVAIFGSGNAAFEAASAISKVSAHVDIYSTSEIKLAHQNHYPGALRIPNAGVLDQYLLKSLDTYIHLSQESFDQMRISDAFKALAITFNNEFETEMIVARGKEHKCTPLQGCHVYDYIIRAMGWEFDASIFSPSVAPAVEKPGEITKRGGKYPSMTAAYESKNVSGLFFAGALAHALDFGQSAGGFIHGFRYTSRALVRYLNVKNHGGTWSNVILSGRRNAFEHALARINTVSSLYQMYGVLADVMYLNVGDILNKSDAFAGVRYFHDVPLRMIQEGYFGSLANDTAPEDTLSGVRLLVTITLEYGVGFSGRFVLDHARLHPTGRPWTRAEKEKPPDLFLHPVLRLYQCSQRGCSRSLRKRNLVHEMHLKEELSTDWTDKYLHQQRLERFLERVQSTASAPRVLSLRVVYLRVIEWLRRES